MTIWLKENIKFYWLVMAMIIISVGLVWFSFSLVKKAQSELDDQNSKLVSLLVKSTNPIQVKTDRAQVTANENMVASSFVKKDKLVEVIVFLENLARDTGNSASVRSVDEATDSDHVVFKVEMSGPYAGLINFLAGLEKSGFLAYPDQINVSKFVEAESKRTLVKTDLTIKFLSF